MTKILCKEKGCVGKVVAKGLCDKHRKRLARHGHTDQTRPKDWGSREKHPLYGSWAWMRRTNLKISELGEWVDFWRFVKDVKERPGEMYVINRIDPKQPFSDTNWKWVLINRWAKNPEDYRKQKNQYAKDYRAKNPRKAKDQNLRKSYGITLKQYEEMLKDQNNGCAICGNPETATKRGSREERSLAIDHCHSTGKIRGLLCTGCNTAIGALQDSSELLWKAILYLERDL